MYASSAWRCYTSKIERDLIDRLLYRLKRRGFLSKDAGDATHYAIIADSKFFWAICENPQHVLANVFPPAQNTGHKLRARVHSYSLPSQVKTKITLYHVAYALY